MKYQNLYGIAENTPYPEAPKKINKFENTPQMKLLEGNNMFQPQVNPQQNIQNAINQMTQPALGIAPPAMNQPSAPNVAGNQNTNQGFYSPELEKLKQQFLTQNWFAGSPYKSLFENIMTQLASPVNLPVGLTAEEQQEMINRARANIMGQTQAQLGQLTEAMGGRGFRLGESGRADTLAAQLLRSGQQQLGGVISNLMLDEAQRRFQQNLAAQQFNLARLTSIPQFAQLLESGDLNRIRMGLEALQAGGGLEQFLKQYQLQQQQLEAQAAAAGAAQDFRERQFQYQQQMDALNMLLGLYGREMGAQQELYNPYWRAILGGL